MKKRTNYEDEQEKKKKLRICVICGKTAKKELWLPAVGKCRPCQRR